MNQNQKIIRLSAYQKGQRILAACFIFTSFENLCWGNESCLEPALLQIGQKLTRSEGASAHKNFYVVQENGQELGEDKRVGTLKASEEACQHIVAFSSRKKTFDDFTLTDYQVEGHSGKDIVYTQSQKMRAFLPRGLAVVRDQGNHIVHELLGLRKFDYNWSYVTEDSVRAAQKVKFYAMEKENGSAAHITAFMENDQLFWVIGSKNAHEVISHAHFEQITQGTWENPQNYSFGSCGNYAQNITYLWRQTWAHLGDEQKEAILNKMTQEGVTFVGEAIFKGDEHLRKYDAAVQDNILFFAMTSAQSLEDGLLAHSPLKGLDLFKQYGLKHAPMFQALELESSVLSFKSNKPVIESEEYNQLVKDVAQMKNSEGVALYMALVDQDGVEKTVDLRKCKAADYTLMRQVREHVVKGYLFGKTGIAEKLKSSLNDFDPEQKPIIEDVLLKKTDSYVELVNFFKNLPSEYIQKAKKGKKVFTQSAQEAFRCQWVSIEEQFANKDLESVSITIDGETLSFPKA